MTKHRPKRLGQAHISFMKMYSLSGDVCRLQGLDILILVNKKQEK